MKENKDWNMKRTGAINTSLNLLICYMSDQLVYLASSQRRLQRLVRRVFSILLFFLNNCANKLRKTRLMLNVHKKKNFLTRRGF